MTCQKIVVAAALITITACGGDANPVATTPLQWQIEYRLISQHLAFVDQVNYRAAEGERQETNVDFPWSHSMSVLSGTAVWMKATKIWLGPSCFRAELWVDGEIKSIDEQCGSGTASVSFP